MNILPVMNVRCNTPTALNKRCNNANSIPSFGAELSDAQVSKVLNMLKNKVTDVQVFDSLLGIKKVSDSLMAKYNPFGMKSVGAMVIPEEHLAEFLNNNQRLYANIDDYRGICVAVGDKYGPVETWTKAYEAIVALVSKSVLH